MTTEFIVDREPIPEVVTEPVAPTELPEHITRLSDALDSIWTGQTVMMRLLNAINYPIYDNNGQATPEQLAHMQFLLYSAMRYIGYVEEQLRYTLYIQGHDVNRTVTLNPVVKEE
jgi:hypothetical protein